MATILAQIACDGSSLPQGSPCSPVISNLIGHIVDIRLARLAKKHKCRYSRYADDITFSTNLKNFPCDLAVQVDSGSHMWALGDELLQEISNVGFSANLTKTRMQKRQSRQVVTGLIVNNYVNTPIEYYKLIRSMCDHLFRSGAYFRMEPAVFRGGALTDPPVQVVFTEVGVLQGMFAHLLNVKQASLGKKASKSPIILTKDAPAYAKLYRRFLFFKYFISNNRPIVVTEGKTDAVYLRSALEQLAPVFPALIDSDRNLKIDFFKYSESNRNYLGLGGGTGDLVAFISNYKRSLKSFGYKPLMHPVIVCIDNDDGAASIFLTMKNQFNISISHSSADLFYNITDNLYLIKTPPKGTKSKTFIEEFFEDQVLATQYNGKTFDPNKEHEEGGKYGKQIFAEKIVRPNKGSINFGGFDAIFERIVAVLADYKAP